MPLRTEAGSSLAPLVRAVTAELPVPDRAAMLRAAAGEATLAAHDAAARGVPALDAIEVRSPASPAASRARLRIATWNLERCKHVEASASLLQRSGADLALLSEMDLGMARSGQRHTTRDLAAALGSGYAFGVEFVELGHGVGQELEHASEPNRVGLHGNAIVAAASLRDPVLIRLERSGAWFQRDWHHRRIGGRMGVAATVESGGGLLSVVSTHLENIASAEERRRQIEPILAWLATMPDNPAVVAGDFNTADLPDAGSAETDWFTEPDRYEPLFGAMRAAGFQWHSANQAEHGRRLVNDGRPSPKLRRVDWFFTRGVEATNPQSWPAVDDAGRPISDHDLMTVDIVVGTP